MEDKSLMGHGQVRALRRLFLLLGVVCSLGLVAWLGSIHPGALSSEKGVRSALLLLSSFLEPELGGAFLTRVLRLLLESVAIGVFGLFLALLFAVPLACLAARPPGLPDAPLGSRWVRFFRFGLRWTARSLLSVLRAVPDLVWAFLFVRILGLGAGPAVLAIMLSFAGIVGKLYAELIDTVDPAPVQHLLRAGVGPLGVFFYAIFPQVKGPWVGYALFRLECAIRSAAILGIVGAGGIGSEIALGIRYFQYDKLATALIALVVVIALFEGLSSLLRRHRLWWSFLLFLLSSVGAYLLLDVSWSGLFNASALQQFLSFFDGFRGPYVGGAFVWKACAEMGQTLAMAWLATICAGFAAFFCSPFVAKNLWRVPALQEPPPQIQTPAFLAWFVTSGVRLFFQLMRSLPVLVWALVFIVWVGPGPLAGVLSLCCHNIGILGRLFGETYEEVGLQPLRLLEASGTSIWGRWLFGMLPQAGPRLLAFTLFRFEVNIRVSAVVGFVGAGGIGDEIHTAISLFHFRSLATWIMAGCFVGEVCFTPL